MMLAQAIRGEAYRTLRNPRAIFWSYALVPLFLLIFGLAIDLAVRVEVAAISPAAEPARLAMRSLGAGGNPIAQLFYAIGAAALVANEYRWESWRLIAPRNARANLILAKYVVYLGLVAASLFAIVVAEFGSTLIAATAKGTAIAWPVAGDWAKIASVWGASLLELATLGALAMLGAVVTRSLLGGALPAFLASLGQALLLAFDQPPPTINPALTLPVHAGDMARSWAAGVPGGVALAAAAALALWIVILLGAALALFERQDLARE